MDINEADLTSPTSDNSHPNLQEYAAVTTKEPIPDEFKILNSKQFRTFPYQKRTTIYKANLHFFNTTKNSSLSSMTSLASWEN